MARSDLNGCTVATELSPTNSVRYIVLTSIGRSTFFLVNFSRDDVAALIVSILSSVLILFQSAGQSRIGTAPR